MAVSLSTKSKILAIFPKITACLSLVGSSCILYYIITRKRRNKPIRLYHRLMLGMSLSDLLASHVYFLGTWMIPAGTVGRYGPVFLASGNQATCNSSGFFTQLASLSPLYNASLALYYLLLIRFQWTEKQLCQVEIWLHSIPIGFAVGTSIAGLVMDLYGSVEWLCWINPDPPQPHTKLYQWLFLFVPVWVCALFVTVVMFVLWKKAKTLELALQRYTVEQEPARRSNRRSREMAIQGLLYAAAFWITWLFPTMQRITELTKDENYFALQVLDTTLLPLQGAINMAVYLRPRLKTYRRRHPEMGVCEFLLHGLGKQWRGGSSVRRLPNNSWLQKSKNNGCQAAKSNNHDCCDPNAVSDLMDGTSFVVPDSTTLENENFKEAAVVEDAAAKKTNGDDSELEQLPKQQDDDDNCEAKEQAPSPTGSFTTTSSHPVETNSIEAPEANLTSSEHARYFK